MSRGRRSDPGESESQDENGVRLDRWLWSVRMFKTRSVAAAACRKSRVRMRGAALKPSKMVRPGEVYEVGRGSLEMRVKVLAVPEARVAAKRVAEFLEDLTPGENYRDAARASREKRERAVDERLTVRPSKRDLREIRRWLGRD